MLSVQCRLVSSFFTQDSLPRIHDGPPGESILTTHKARRTVHRAGLGGYMNTIRAILAVLLFCAFCIAASPASAETTEKNITKPSEEASPDRAMPIDVKKVVDTIVHRNYTKYSQPITSCGSASKHVTCSIGRTETIQRTIQLDMGITRNQVAASLGISASHSLTTQVSCNATRLKPGQRLWAYPFGTQYQYKIQRITWLGTSKSNWLFAFNPRGAITCKVS